MGSPYSISQHLCKEIRQLNAKKISHHWEPNAKNKRFDCGWVYSSLFCSVVSSFQVHSFFTLWSDSLTIEVQPLFNKLSCHLSSVNPLTPRCDQSLISPYSIIPESYHVRVERVNWPRTNLNSKQLEKKENTKYLTSIFQHRLTIDVVINCSFRIHTQIRHTLYKNGSSENCKLKYLAVYTSDLVINNGNRTEWSPIWSEMIHSSD